MLNKSLYNLGEVLMANEIDETIAINIGIACVPATVENGRFDVNGDGEITWEDALEIWNHRDGAAPYDQKYDMNCDGVVNYQDSGLCWINRTQDPICEEITDQYACETFAGCFWYNGSCHSAIEEGLADASNLVYDDLVLPETDILIDYNVTNNGGGDTLWGGIYEGPDASAPLIGGYWEETFTEGQTIPKSILIVGGITMPVNWYLQVGHLE